VDRPSQSMPGEINCVFEAADDEIV